MTSAKHNPANPPKHVRHQSSIVQRHPADTTRDLTLENLFEDASPPDTNRIGSYALGHEVLARTVHSAPPAEVAAILAAAKKYEDEQKSKTAKLSSNPSTNPPPDKRALFAQTIALVKSPIALMAKPSAVSVLNQTIALVTAPVTTQRGVGAFDKTVALEPVPRGGQETMLLPPISKQSPKAMTTASTPMPVAPIRPGPKLSGTMLMPPNAIAAAAVARKAEKKSETFNPFNVDVVDNVDGLTRYRDAIATGDQAILLMTDFGTNEIDPNLVARWQEAVRSAVAAGASANAVLQVINRELSMLGLEASAACAHVDARKRTIRVACAGSAGAPFLVRTGDRFARAREIPNVILGRVRSTQFMDQTLAFESGDMLLVPSIEWVPVLARLFAQPVDLAKRTIAFAMREHRAQPLNGSLLRLALR